MRKGKLIRRAAILLAMLLMAAFAAGCSTSKDPVVLKVGNVKMYLSDFVSTYNSYYSYYSAFGIYDVSTTEKLHAFQDTVMKSLRDTAVCLYMAQQNGLTLTPEEEAECETATDTAMSSLLNNYKTQVDASITEATEIEAECLKLLKAELRKNGYTFDSYRETVLEDERNSALLNKQRQLIYDEVEVADAEVEEYYNTTLAADLAAYGEDGAQYLADYNSYSSGSRIVPLFVPDGYKRVTHILVETEEIAKEVQEKLAGGADWNELVKEYSKDTGMPEEGYYVSADTISAYYAGFGEAAVALKKVGDVSEPVTTTGGLHLIRLEEIVKSTTVELDDELRSAIKDKLLSDGQTSLYTERVAEWTESAPITEYEARYRYIGMASN